MSTSDQWCLCWRQHQNALHIEPMERHLSANRAAYRDNTAGDYRLLLIGTREEVDTAATAARQTIGLREVGREREML